MRKNFLLITLAAIVCFAYAGKVSAETSATRPKLPAGTDEVQPVKVADVSIYNGQIEKQEGGNMVLAFDLHNGEGYQPQIIYAVKLVSIAGDNEQLVDVKVFGEDIINLAANETKHLEVSYVAPKFLGGSYNLYIDARDGSGFPLGQLMVGSVNLQSNGDFVEVSGCNENIDGRQDNQQYNPGEILSVDKGEKIIAHCSVENKSQQNLNLKLHADLYSQSMFGKSISSENISEFSLNAGEKSTINFEVPKTVEPQINEVVFNIAGKDGQKLSNIVIFNHIVRGLSATIRDVRFDKNSYAVGDVAHVSLMVFSSTGIYENLEQETLQKITAQIVASNGNECANSFDKNLTEGRGLFVLDIPVTQQCENPGMSVRVLDKNGNVVANSDVAVNEKPKVEEVKFEVKEPEVLVEKKNNPIKPLMIAASLLLLLILIVFFCVKGRRIKKDAVKMLLLFSFVGLGFAHQVKAATFYNNMWTDYFPGRTIPILFTINMDKATYTPGETITVSGSAAEDPYAAAQTKGYCTSGCSIWGKGNYLSATVNSSKKILLDTYTGGFQGHTNWIPEYTGNYMGPSLSGSKTFTAPNSAGNYSLSYAVGSDLDYTDYNYRYYSWWASDSSGTVGYSVSAAYNLNVTAGTGSAVTSSPAGISCNSGTGTCNKSYANGTSVALTASANSGYVNPTWTTCPGTLSGTVCTVTMNSAKNAVASATIQSFTLNVSTASGSKVTSFPAGINCNGGFGTCSAQFASGTAVALTASANSGYKDPTWATCPGILSGAVCSVTMDADKSTQSSVSLAQVCGNSVIEGTEQCDNGSSVNGTSCPNDCSGTCTKVNCSLQKGISNYQEVAP